MTFVMFSKNDNIRKSSLFTPWSFIHFLSGIISYLYLKRFTSMSETCIFLILLLIHTLYEIKDLSRYTLKLHKSNSIWYNNTVVNSIGDTITFILGIVIGMIFKNNIINLSNSNITNISLLYLCIILIYIKFELG